MPKAKPSTAAAADDCYIAPSTGVGEYARSIVRRLGLPEPRPLTGKEKTLQMPENLADVDSRDLGRLMTGFAAMQNFADYQAKIMENDLDSLDSQVVGLVESHLPQMRASTVAEKKARARSLPQVREKAGEADTVRAVYGQICTLREIYGRCYNAVSREISRRQGMVEP